MSHAHRSRDLPIQQFYVLSRPVRFAQIVSKTIELNLTHKKNQLKIAVVVGGIVKDYYNICSFFNCLNMINYVLSVRNIALLVTRAVPKF